MNNLYVQLLNIYFIKWSMQNSSEFLFWPEDDFCGFDSLELYRFGFFSLSGSWKSLIGVSTELWLGTLAASQNISTTAEQNITPTRMAHLEYDPQAWLEKQSAALVKGE